MLNKSDCRKNVKEIIEEIITDFTVILDCVRSSPSTRCIEMESLVIAKRRMHRLTEQLQMIHRYLVILKYHHRNEQREIKKSSNKFVDFSVFFEKLNANQLPLSATLSVKEIE